MGVSILENRESSMPVAEQVAEQLGPYLGDFNAAVWIKVVARRDLDKAPDELEPEDLETLMDGLRPSLSTFMGRGAADDIRQKILREVG